MAILIKGMEMPRNCMACDFEQVDEYELSTECSLIYKGHTYKCRTEGRLPDCPLVEIAEVQDAVSRQAAIDLVNFECGKWTGLAKTIENGINGLPSPQPEQRWIPVTKDTLPVKGKVVIVKGKTGTWDFGTYRGYSHVIGEGDIHLWEWKKNTLKRVYWWMYKDGALPEPYGGEQDE